MYSPAAVSEYRSEGDTPMRVWRGHDAEGGVVEKMVGAKAEEHGAADFGHSFVCSKKT